ncbi:MAG: FkbM family methyltransferase [Quinella sp. 3Q1]|nr:FkbM family methyltransferase [Quinella sp. 3Q1]MBR6887495.1 FkbM family methyltransferase [Selenomonadaceae bacterium]
MFKVVLWDYTGESANWAETFLKSDVKVIRTLRPDDPDQAEVIMRGDWDFVLIFEKGQREIFNAIFKTMREMKVSTKNIVFANDLDSWQNNFAAVYALLKPETPMHDTIQRLCNFFNHRLWHHYIAASAEGLNYVATSADDFVIEYMYLISKNHAAHEMKIFRDLSKKYYGVDDSAGYFLDLGANIGTTGIYFCKKLSPNLNLLAFEPDAENFKLLRVNTILNDMEDRAKLVNCGLGDKFDEMTMYRYLENPGGNGLFSGDGLFKFNDGSLTETVKIIPLDSYLAEKNIAAEEIKYIWIDTEGFEPQVLLGAKNLLAKNPAPIFMECNLRLWDNSGYFESMMTLLTKNYSHFIHVQGGETVYPLEALRTIKRPNNLGGQIGDIFLIKKGAID